MSCIVWRTKYVPMCIIFLAITAPVSSKRLLWAALFNAMLLRRALLVFNSSFRSFCVTACTPAFPFFAFAFAFFVIPVTHADSSIMNKLFFENAPLVAFLALAALAFRDALMLTVDVCM